ncbi:MULTISPECIES: hypothetical protein [Marinobacter]|uniref:Ezrin/radixin/moesin C-terminal domain-containing protein n=1 Tax=Marinobacter xiaoshiensis TaxID=3073652 RepID=A0ABU2HDL9_9GAMM|nr:MULTISPECIES: hypothetical protein [unclassified Marinobacter]MBK1888387.1 hypothetical protein [Marinobacter sp. DY40_1A1]MDS1308656.1 hypothetical protein [Marinobacter sp. F60267]
MNEYGKVGAVLAFFLLIAAVFASLLSSNIAVVTHAVAVVVLSSGYSQSTAALQKTSVDRIYYSVGALAVALVFIYETPDRQQLDLLSDIRQTRIVIAGNEAKHSILEERINRHERLQEAVRTNEAAVLAAVQKGAVGAQANAEEIQEVHCDIASQILFSPIGLEAPTGLDKGKDSLMLNRHPDVFAANECKRFEGYAQHPAWDRLLVVESLNDFKNAKEHLNIPIAVSFVLGINRYTIDELYEVLIDSGSNERLRSERNQILEIQNQLRDQLEELENELKSLKDSTRFTWVDQLVGNIVKLGWPFLLISLLGLKLTRSE